MTVNEKIIQNFATYDTFLATLNDKDRKIALSLKMMYSIHMENNGVNKNYLFTMKQLFRFLIKLVSIPFYKIILTRENIQSGSAILDNTYIETYISKKINISLIQIDKKITINLKYFVIYRDLYRTIYLLFKTSKLKKRYLLALIHRVIDYLVLYHTIKMPNINTLFIENDRTPVNLALIHKCVENEIKTVKYDNWLIDPINHNDVYCEYYYYPGIYHKKIIQSFESNNALKYIKGGFPYWDHLVKYKNIKENKIKKIVYFTQFGISLEIHKKYIFDIRNCLKKLGIKHEIVIKIHPREDSDKYKKLLKDFYVIRECDNVYSLIEGADYCFSIFSTISLEAKHIMKNSFFINYDTNNFDIVDYDALKLDVIRDEKILNSVLSGEFIPVSQDKFIKYINSQYPYSIENLQRFINGFNNHSIVQ